MEKIEITDLCALYIGFYQRDLLVRYLECRRNPVVHKLEAVNKILSCSKGCLLFEHQLYHLLALAGMEKQLKKFRMYKYLSRNDKESLRKKFLDGLLDNGYVYVDAEELFDFIKTNAHNVWRRRGIIANFKQLIKRMCEYYDYRDNFSEKSPIVNPKYAERIKLEMDMRLMEWLVDKYN